MAIAPAELHEVLRIDRPVDHGHVDRRVDERVNEVVDLVHPAHVGVEGRGLHPEASSQAPHGEDRLVGSFIEEREGGFGSEISQGGGNVSGGQRQRLSIARMILKDPRIVILDEATSSVDAETERAIQESFEKLMEGRTAFIIAHRLSTIRDADMILVMRDGDVVETGTHTELLAKGGFYAELYNSQFEPAA